MKFYKKYYNEDYIKYNLTWHSEDSYFKFIQIKKLINKNNLKFKTFCEVGCGAGKYSTIYPNDIKIKIFLVMRSLKKHLICKKMEIK